MPQSATRIRIVKELNEMIKDFKKNPLLPLVQEEASPEQWKAFAAKRLQSATAFEAVLGKAIALSATCGHDAVHSALTENLSDEIGRQSDGSIDTTRAHDGWRKDFARALQLPASSGYPDYDLMMSNVASSSEPFLVYGVLLALERLIPVEFTYIREGMDTLFPSVFVVSAKDSKEVRSNKLKARHYIDDHIDHDARQHFPDLLDALEQISPDAKALTQLSKAIALVATAKRTFYNDPSIFN
ncbi:MAG: hypothetical protein AAB865_00495 [Patescibacteria group bacterium]